LLPEDNVSLEAPSDEAFTDFELDFFMGGLGLGLGLFAFAFGFFLGAGSSSSDWCEYTIRSL
jgi:hypothetical protein